MDGPSDRARELRPVLPAHLRGADIRLIKVHHVLHTVASLLKALRVPARDAQVILGHSRLAVTLEIYTHADDEAQLDALTPLHDLFDQVDPPRGRGPLPSWSAELVPRPPGENRPLLVPFAAYVRSSDGPLRAIRTPRPRGCGLTGQAKVRVPVRCGSQSHPFGKSKALCRTEARFPCASTAPRRALDAAASTTAKARSGPGWCRAHFARVRKVAFTGG